MLVEMFHPRESTLVILLSAGVLVAGRLPAQSLAPGPHAVGFRVVAVTDESRGYWSRDPHQAGDAAGAGDSHRPLLIQLWYPARPSTGRAMRFADYFTEYVRLRARAYGDPGDTGQTALRAHLGPLRPQLSPNDAADSGMTRVLETPVVARRDAAPLEGPFPVVLTIGVDPAFEQSARYEYLASHGYVVAGLPWMGSAPWAFGIGEWQPNGIDAMATDMGFLHAWLRNFPSADRSRIAWAGALTPAGAIFQSRTRLLDALAVLEGDWQHLESTPGFDPNAFTIPILSITTAAPDTGGFLYRARRAERWIKRIDIDHVATYQFARTAQPSRGDHTGWESMTVDLRRFLDASLRADSSARRALTMPRLAALPSVPSAPEFLELVRHRRFEDAERVLRDGRAADSAYVPASEADLILASRFASFGAAPEVVSRAFALAIEAFPRSPGVREAAGDIAVMLLRSPDRARAHFEAALRLVPSLPDPVERNAMETRIRAKLTRLGGR